MEIHQLRYFVAVAEEGSFSNAAEREHVSQPSLSQQIHKLEEELNQQLFDRLPRSVVLTEAGRTLLVYARQILSGIAEARQAVTALEHEVAGKLSVGAIPSIALYVLPRLIGSFQRSYPKVTFELFEDTTEKLAQQLEDGTLDLVIASGSDEIPNLARHSLGREPLLMLVPEKHRLARRKSIRWSELASEKFLLLHEQHSLSIQVRQLLAANHLKPELVLQGAQLVTIAADGGGGTWGYRDTANDAEYGVREGMRGRAVCQAGADARADVAAESLAGREQSRRSIPQGSHGSFFKLTLSAEQPRERSRGEPALS